MIRQTSSRLYQTPKTIVMLISFSLILIVGVFDYLTGYELSFATFYFIPVGVAAWFAGRDVGIGASLVSPVVWQVTNNLAGQVFSSPLIYVWNTGIRIVALSILAILIHKLRVALEHERTLSRTDSLTGAMNRRAFYEAFAKELLRAQRYERSLTIAYIDLDNFKAVNDRFGHSAGDTLLRTVIATIESAIRGTDTVARLGGDEFALLLPDTDSTGAKKVLTQIHDHLQQEMDRHGWPVTFSVGAITCLAPSTPIEAILGDVDRVMYRIKKTGKNAVRLESHPC